MAGVPGDRMEKEYTCHKNCSFSQQTDQIQQGTEPDIAHMLHFGRSCCGRFWGKRLCIEFYAVNRSINLLKHIIHNIFLAEYVCILDINLMFLKRKKCYFLKIEVSYFGACKCLLSSKVFFYKYCGSAMKCKGLMETNDLFLGRLTTSPLPFSF